MSNEGERRCPLCAEEMDWTDQQFRPCKCGYQVCVWCWHQIMAMAEKDETEGRCPACRTVYEKEKIVAMQADCENVVTKKCSKKSKPPKAKPKTIEVKKDLTNVRVIQRKMAYIIGLPLNLADEDLLQRKEYFGQYGKIVKISLSRTSGGAVQQFINETCSVYVTYSKEEEALRCIQSVHGFVLEGRFLRASFGTAKYCHAWLKNTLCNNPACLYLHTVGPEEDSFGKDEMAAVHTRNRVQQIVGANDNVLRRSGSTLPSPVDDMSNGSSPFIEKITFTTCSSDAAHNGHVSGNLRSPNTMTSFVDVIGRSSDACPDKDIIHSENRRLLDLNEDLSRIKLQEDSQIEDACSNSMLYTLPSSSHLDSRSPDDADPKAFADDLLREGMLHYKDPLSTDFCNVNDGGYLNVSSYSAKVSEDPTGLSGLHERNHNTSNISTDQTSVHSLEDEMSLPITCVNSVLNSRSNELKFQSSAKSDRVYRGSNSFSNEEIVEHLRRIGDNNLSNDEDISSFDAVETTIISNILSMSFDSSDDLLTLPNGLSDILDERDDQHGSLWNPYTNGKSGLSFAKEDGYVSQFSSYQSSNNNLGQFSSACSGRKDYGNGLEHYLSSAQHQAPRSPSLAPPGFSLPCRDAPPGFSTFEKNGRIQYSPSGGLVKNASLVNGGYLQVPSAGSNGISTEIDLMDSVVLSCGNGKPGNVLENSIIGTRPAFNNDQLSSYDEEAKLLLRMQQPLPHSQDSKYSGFLLQQNQSTCKGTQFPARAGDELSALDNAYGLPPRLMYQPQTHDPSSLMQVPQCKMENMHISNGHQYNYEEVLWNNGYGIGDIQRNERVGLDKYFSGYDDLVYQMAGSGDLYNRAFQM